MEKPDKWQVSEAQEESTKAGLPVELHGGCRLVKWG